MIDWHHLFGVVLTDLFTGSCFEVELEKDLSQKMQLLDVVILRKKEGRAPDRLPDGLEDLADHNLLTYKSHHESLGDWSLKELTGHYVNYRKQVSPGFDDLLPEDSFHLYAVCARFPQKLSGQLTLTPLKPGVYDIERGTDRIRLIVLSEVAEEEHNAPLHLFSAVPDIVQFGAQHFLQRSSESSTVIKVVLLRDYLIEGFEMPYTMADFRREVHQEVLSELTPEELLRYLHERKILDRLPSEELLRSFSPDKLREIRRELDQLEKEGNGAHE